MSGIADRVVGKARQGGVGGKEGKARVREARIRVSKGWKRSKNVKEG